MGSNRCDRRRFRRRLLGTVLERLGAENSGTTAVEYGIIVAAIAGAIIGIIFLIGDDLATLFHGLGDKLRSRT